MLKLKQYFCKHKFKLVGKQRHVQENLWQCEKCGVFYIQHYGIGVGYHHKTPHIGGWVPPSEKIDID